MFSRPSGHGAIAYFSDTLKFIYSLSALLFYTFSGNAFNCVLPVTLTHSIAYFSDTLKFIYSEKATRFCKISTNYLTGST